VWLIEGGEEIVRSDALYILKKKFQHPLARIKTKLPLQYREVTYHLSDIVNLPTAVSTESAFTLTVIRWEKGLLNEKETKLFLRGCRDSKYWFAIVDATGEVGKVFKEVFPKLSKGVSVDCRKISEDEESKKSLVSRRLGIVGASPNEDVIKYLASGDEIYGGWLFNIFYILEALKEPKVDVDMLRKHSLMVPNIEYYLMKTLLDKGKLAFLSLPTIDYDDGKLLRCIIRELILILNCKTVRGNSDQKKCGMVGLPYMTFLAYKDKLKKVDLLLLYRRLYLTFKTLRYGGLKGSVLLLLSMW
jgi:hypothetical protein